MQTEKSPSELLECIHNIIAKDIAGKPIPRRKAVADPALWRAIQNHQRNGSEGQCGFRVGPGSSR
jgi:hypothetical protein